MAYEEVDPSKVKPCPFCGGKPMLYSVKVSDTVASTYIECGEEACNAYGPNATTLQEAIDKWNERK